MANTMDMTRGRPLPIIVRYGTPLMLTSLLQQLYSLCDSLIIGRLLGLEAFAAIGAAAFVAALPQSMLLGFSLGYEAVLSRLYGAGDADGFRSAGRRAGALSFWGALVGSILLIWLRVPLLRLLGTPQELMDLAEEYLLVIYGGLSIRAAFDWAAAMLRATGDSRTPLKATFISSAFNVLLDLFLIHVVHMGVKGVALGTVAGQLMALLICLGAMNHEKIKFPTATRRDVDGSMKQILFMGLPPMLRDGVIAVGGLFVQSVINSFGVALIAGMTAAGVYFSFLIMAGNGIEGAVAAYVGQNTGAGHHGRIRRGVRTAAVLAASLSTLVAVAAWFLAPYLIALITGYDDPETLEKGVYALRCMALFLPFLYFLCMYRAALQSLGDSVTPMLSGFVELGGRIFCVLVLPSVIGYTAVCIANGCGWLGAAALLIGRYMAVCRRNRSGDTISP